MYAISCARCNQRLTEQEFTSYDEAVEAARALGYPGDSDGEFVCEVCHRSGSQHGHAREIPRARSGSPSRLD